MCNFIKSNGPYNKNAKIFLKLCKFETEDSDSDDASKNKSNYKIVFV